MEIALNIHIISIYKDDSCENKLCGQACNWQLDVAGRCDKGGNCSLDYKHLGCSIHGMEISPIIFYFSVLSVLYPSTS